MRPITVTVGNMTTAANATAFRTNTAVVAGDLVLDGPQATNGIGLLEVDRNILFAITGATTGILFMEGANTAGHPVSEATLVPTGFSGAAMSVNQYRKISRVGYSGTMTALSIGTGSSGTSAWVGFDPWSPGTTAIQVTVEGTVNYTVQTTLDNSTDVTSPVYGTPFLTWVNSSDTAAVGATTTIQSNLLFTPQFARILLNSGTGLVMATFSQSGAP